MSDNLLLQSVREFVAREVAPAADRVDQSGELPENLWREMGQHGLAGLTIPAPWGGVGAELSTTLAAMEALAAGCGSTAWAFLAHCCAAAGILAAGTEGQKHRYLPALAEGRLVGSALAATETGGGSNPMSIRTVAEADGEDFALGGSKLFITQSGAADVYLVLARTDPTPGPTALTCFLVEKGDPGLTFGRREETMGLHGIQLREMVFDRCRLPATRVLGGVGGGLGIVGAVSGFAVLGAAAAALGLAQAALEATQAHLKARTVLGQPLAAIPGVQARMVEVLMTMAGARAWLTSARVWYDEGAKGLPLPAWMAKVAVTEAAVRVIDQCIGLHGASGYSRALPLERYYRDARAYCIHWGQNDVLRDTVGKMALA